jgi:hypothetical protein
MDMGGNGLGLMLGTIRAFARGTEENNRKQQQGYTTRDCLRQVSGTAEAILHVFSNTVLENRIESISFQEEGFI